MSKSYSWWTSNLSLGHFLGINYQLIEYDKDVYLTQTKGKLVLINTKLNCCFVFSLKLKLNLVPKGLTKKTYNLKSFEKSGFPFSVFAWHVG